MRKSLTLLLTYMSGMNMLSIVIEASLGDLRPNCLCFGISLPSTEDQLTIHGGFYGEAYEEVPFVGIGGSHVAN